MRRIEEELGRRAPEGVSKMRIDALRKDLVGMSSLRQSAATVATPAREPTEELDESAKLKADAERQMRATVTFTLLVQVSDHLFCVSSRC